LTRAARTAEVWSRAILGLRSSPHVIDIRTIGLMAGIELASAPGEPGKRAYEVFTDCFRNGLLVRVTGDIIALSPPLIAEAVHIDELVEKLSGVLARTA
jgi:beta-alanine--pyruvate transaminase